MQIGNRFRAYPTPAQERILLQWTLHQRFITNAKDSLSGTGQFAGNSPVPGSLPVCPKDMSSRERTDGSRPGSPPAFSSFGLTTQRTPRSVFSGQGRLRAERGSSPAPHKTRKRLVRIFESAKDGHQLGPPDFCDDPERRLLVVADPKKDAPGISSKTVFAGDRRHFLMLTGENR